MERQTLIKGSQRFLTASLLTLSGGFLDAYTYFARGGVFANAQTGNMIKFGIFLSQGEYARSAGYLIPVFAFISGILLARLTDAVMRKHKIRCIRRTVLLIEAAVLLGVMMIPQKEELNTLANTLVSFVCAMQMEAFRSFSGEAYATVVSTGNLRKAIENLFDGICLKDRKTLGISARYFLITFLFIMGVCIGTLLTIRLQTYAVLFPVLLLGLTFIVITVSFRQIIAEEKKQTL